MRSTSPDLRYGDEDPPSPSAVSRPIDIPTAASSYAQSWDVDFGTGPGLAYTPSYVGSFGSNNESGWGDREATAVYSGNPTGDLFDEKYEPEGYQSQGSPYILMDSQTGYGGLGSNGDSLFQSQDPTGIHLGFGDVDPQNHYSPRPGVAGSPGSSIGFGDIGNGHPRSRASSLSSNPGAQSSPYMASADYSSQQPLYDHFTKLSFNSNLDSSPSWNNQQVTLPSISSPGHQNVEFQQTVSTPPSSSDMSPSTKPLSPPTLVIPGETSSTLKPPRPSLQADQEQGGPQPAINLVPATPVSGGGAAGGAQLPFQTMLANLTRRNQGNLYGRGTTSNEAQPPSTGFQVSMDPNLGEGSGHSQGDAMTWTSIISASGQSQGTATSSLPSSNRAYHHGYNYPVPNQDINTSQQQPQLAMQLTANNTLPSLAHHAQSDPVLQHLPPFQPSPSQQPSSLSNLMSFSDSSLLGAPSSGRNRSKSDTSSRPPAWLDPSGTSSSMNADLGGGLSSNSFTLPFNLPRPTFGSSYMPQSDDAVLGNGDTGLRRSNSDGGRHKRGVKSEDWGGMGKTRIIATSNSEFIRPVTGPDGNLAPVDPRAAAGPLRRRGSGAGHERNSSLSSLRSTPYQRPSPHTSPGPSPHHSPVPDPANLPETGQYMHVERPLVTTPATKTASANRRRAEATFVCPVPGCGSTFTRHFNLRGHLRSHNEERPYKCKWPGCEKGFARQHDCKRHEALHLNIRPYTCEGCQKTFARMDALNRHLRSEGGVDCQKHQQPTDGSPRQSGEQPPFPKIEGLESASWNTSSATVVM